MSELTPKLQDAARAIGLVRANAREWRIRLKRADGILGGADHLSGGKPARQQPALPRRSIGTILKPRIRMSRHCSLCAADDAMAGELPGAQA